MTLPAQPIDPDRTFAEGDEAFRAGDAAQAQRLFGLVFLHDPVYREGMVGSALTETCRILGNDCALVMGRLDALRIDYLDQYGPRESWFPQQESDYRSILACFDLALDGRFDSAYAEGYRVINAPLPLFAQLARLCVDRVQASYSQQQLAQQQQAALPAWQADFPRFIAAWEILSVPLDVGDWDGIVDRYPQYKIAEEPIIGQLQSGVLASHPQVGPEMAQAAQIVADIAVWEEEHLDGYEEIRQAVTALEEDPEYNQSLVEYQTLFNQLEPIRQEIATLQVARDATEGSERRSIDRRIEAKESELRDVRRGLRRVMGTINNIRDRHGLTAREEPYGLEF